MADPASLLKKLYISIKDSFDSHSRLIRGVLEESRIPLYDELKKHSLVCDLRDKDVTYENIRTQVVKGSFKRSDNVDELQSRCQHFLTSLLRLNKQSAIDLSKKLRKEWNCEARKIDIQKLAFFLSEETPRKEEVQLIEELIKVDDDPLMSPIIRQSSTSDRHHDHQGHSQHQHNDHSQHHRDHFQHHNDHSQRHYDHHHADFQNHRQHRDHSRDRYSKEMNTDNEPAKAFEEHYDSIVGVISKEDIFSKAFCSLCEAQLVPAAIEDQANKITNRTIQVKCVMESVYTGIEKAVQPAKLLEKFLFILNLPELREKFTDVIQKFKEKGYSPNLSRNTLRKHETMTQHPPQNTISQQPRHTYSSDSSSATMTPHHLTNAEESRGLEDNGPPSHHLQPANQPVDYQSSLKMRYKHIVSTIGHRRKSWKYFHVSASEKSVLKVSPEQPDGFLDLACIPQQDNPQMAFPPRTLILGAPGVGKSSVVNELCRLWSEGHLLKAYQYVIRLRANDPRVRKAKELKDLVPDKAYDSISQSYGRNCLFILDGYEDFCEDEEIKENGFYDCLIRGEDLPDELLAASLIVTTRPWCAKQIMKYFPSEVEILGFTPTTQKEYLTCMYQLGEADVERFLSQPRTMAQCMSNPFLLTTLIEIFIEYKQVPDVHAEQSWPKTLTSLYGFLIRLLVLNFVRNNKILLKHLPPAFSIPTGEFSKFPCLIYEHFLKVCSIAYQSMSTHFPPATFEHDDLVTFELINGPETIEYCNGQQVMYEFLHSSIREYLAAYFISRMDEREMEKRIDRLKKSPYKYHLVIEFLFGFGCINELHLEKHRPGHANNEYRVNNFNILRQLCEAQHSCDLIKSAFAKFSKENTTCIILRTFPSPSSFDFWCLGRVIALSGCEWELGFTLRPIRDEHIKSLREGFDSVDSPSGTIKMFKFSFTKVSDKGVNQICQMHQAKVLNQVTEIHLSDDLLTSTMVSRYAPLTMQLKNCCSLSKLMLHHNKIEPGQHRDLIAALKDCRSLEHVSFTDLAPDECRMLISEVKQLKVIELWNITTDCCRAVFESLDNSHVQQLEIHECDIGTETTRILPRTLPRSIITCLKLINCNINDDAVVEHIVVAVKESHRQVFIDLSNNVITDEGGQRLLTLQNRCSCNLLNTYKLNSFSRHMQNNLKPRKHNFDLHRKGKPCRGQQQQWKSYHHGQQKGRPHHN